MERDNRSFEVRREEAVIESLAMHGAQYGERLTVDEILALGNYEFEHHFGDEGPGSYTRCSGEITRKLAEKAVERRNQFEAGEIFPRSSKAVAQ